MASMNISVPDPMRDWVQTRIDTGQYASVSDYVRDLIRRDQSEIHALKTEFRQKIAAGMASLRAGDSLDGEDFLRKLDADLADQQHGA